MPDYGKGSSAIPSENPDGKAVEPPVSPLEQARRERDEAKVEAARLRRLMVEQHKWINNLRAERDEALAKNTELGKMYLDAVSASQGHEMEAAMLEAARDEARAREVELRAELRWIGENSTETPIADAAFQALASGREE